MSRTRYFHEDRFVIVSLQVRPITGKSFKPSILFSPLVHLATTPRTMPLTLTLTLRLETCIEFTPWHKMWRFGTLGGGATDCCPRTLTSSPPHSCRGMAVSLKNGGPRSRADTYSFEGEVKVARESINRWLDVPCRSAVELESTYSSRLNFRLNQSHI